jgi:cellulose biosynthesis protein BcsQ
MLRIMACYNIKGGVGKTTTAVNLACLAARDGLRTVLWDLDPQGGASFCLGAPGRGRSSRKLVDGRSELIEGLQPTAYSGLSVLSAHRSYRNMDLHLKTAKRPEQRLLKIIRPLNKRFDLLILDCAPSISLVSENIFRAADALLMPVVPNPLSLRSVEQVRDFLVRQRLGDIALLPFLSMLDQRKSLHREMLETRPPGFLRTAIPYASEVERMTLRREPLVSYAPAGRAGLAFDALWAEVVAAQGWDLAA